MKKMKELTPELESIFGEFAKDLEASWNEYDIYARDKALVVKYEFNAKAAEIRNSDWYRKAGYGAGENKIRAVHKEYFNKMKDILGSINVYDMLRESDEDIQKRNHRKVVNMIYDLIARCEKKVGEITSVKYLHVGIKCLEGFVEGTKGRVEVRSIFAGGYNIQRLHVRVLVK